MLAPLRRYSVKRTLLPRCLAAAVVFLSSLSIAQSPDDALHAPDGNSYNQIVNIFISALANSPFSATVSASWTRQLPDGTTITLANHRLVIRDSQGRIYQERRRLVPPDESGPSTLMRVEISDPALHIKYFCYYATKICDLTNYKIAATQPMVPVGPTSDGKHYLSREDLGKRDIEGLEAIGARETVTTSAGANGNDRAFAITKEFWYSPELALNLAVTRLDPVHGTQQFTVSNLQLAEPDARVFAVPSGFKVWISASSRQLRPSSRNPLLRCAHKKSGSPKAPQVMQTLDSARRSASSQTGHCGVRRCTSLDQPG